MTSLLLEEAAESVDSIPLHLDASRPAPPNDEMLPAEFTLAWLPEMSPAGLAATLLASLVFLSVSVWPLGGADVWARLTAGRAASAANGELLASDFSRPWLEFQVWRLAGVEGLVLLRALAAAGAAGVATLVASRVARPLFFRRLPIAESASEFARQPPRRTLLAMAIALATLVWSPATNGYLTGIARGEVDALSGRTPYFLANELERRGISGRCLAPADWADYLVWQSGGDIDPLLTAGRRAEPLLAQAHDAIFRAEADWLAHVDRHNVRWLALDHSRHGRLYAAAVDHPRCRTRYLDQQAALIEVLPSPEPSRPQPEQAAASTP